MQLLSPTSHYLLVPSIHLPDRAHLKDYHDKRSFQIHLSLPKDFGHL